MLRKTATSRPARRISAGLLACALFAIAACGRDTPAQVGVTTFDPGDRVVVERITGETLDGKPLTVPTGSGGITIVNAWASWCDPCREEMPILTEIASQYPPDQVMVIGLNVQDEPAQAQQFLADVGADFPSIADPDGSLLATIPGVPPKAVPSTVILDANGAVAVRIIGPLERSVVMEQIRSLLAEDTA